MKRFRGCKIAGTKGRKENSFNIELKPVDGACNPYLALLAVLATGMGGLLYVGSI